MLVGKVESFNVSWRLEWGDPNVIFWMRKQKNYIFNWALTPASLNFVVGRKRKQI